MSKNRNIPFGYCIANGEYALKAKEAEAVKQIFSQYTAGKSLNEIASEMTVPYSQCKPVWNKNMVKRVLDNRRYLGENGFIQIITQDDFCKAEKIKSGKNSRKSSGVKEKPILSVPSELEPVYEPSECAAALTKEINRLLDIQGSDKETVKELIFRCAAEKYSCCVYKERRTGNAD